MEKSKVVRLAIIDDHPIVLDGIRALVDDDPGVKIVIAETSAARLIEKMGEVAVDILMTDIMMPEMPGNELAKIVRAKFPAVKILALSMSGQGHIINEMINDADISGYILKNVTKDELRIAIHKIYAGGICFGDDVLEELGNYKEPANADLPMLTNREIELIQLMEQELGNKEIAAKMFISERTVETHRKNIFRKLGKNTLLGVVKYAYDHKLINNTQ